MAHRRKRPGGPINFGQKQREHHRDGNVAERCFNTLKQWRCPATQATRPPATTPRDSRGRSPPSARDL